MAKKKKTVWVPMYYAPRRKAQVKGHFRGKAPKGKKISRSGTVKFIILRDEFGRIRGFKKQKR